jgi:CRISPR/Cas system-associated endoribonuclease Cas2
VLDSVSAQQPELESQVREEDRTEHLPHGWVEASYDIPVTQNSVRDRIRDILGAHGLMFSSQSVYRGPLNPSMDAELQKELDYLRSTGVSFIFRLLTPSFNESDSVWLADEIARKTLEDMDVVEDGMETLEKAMAGQVTITRPVKKRGKIEQVPVDLLSTGDSRIRDAKKLLDAMDAVTERFQGSDIALAQGEKIQRRIRQVRAWVEKVEARYVKWAEREKARRKKA